VAAGIESGITDVRSAARAFSRRPALVPRAEVTRSWHAGQEPTRLPGPPLSVLRTAPAGIGLCRPARGGGTASMPAVRVHVSREGLRGRAERTDLPADPGPATTFRCECQPRTHLTMTRAEPTIFNAEPIPHDVVDLDLWRWGTALADRHQPDPAEPSRCVDPSCVDQDLVPCRDRQTADRLLDASRAPWPQRWTTRLDALSCGLDRPEFDQLTRWRPAAIDRSVADRGPTNSQSWRALVGPGYPSVPSSAAHRPGDLSARAGAIPS
jgi:hypothetical protein